MVVHWAAVEWSRRVSSPQLRESCHNRESRLLAPEAATRAGVQP
jgi:hypothetical protein